MCRRLPQPHPELAGGDCGGLFIWHADSGRRALRTVGDSHIVNCVVAHPSLPLLAVSGIDSHIKLFSPGEPEEDEERGRERMHAACTWMAPDLKKVLERARALRQARPRRVRRSHLAHGPSQSSFTVLTAASDCAGATRRFVWREVARVPWS